MNVQTTSEALAKSLEKNVEHAVAMLNLIRSATPRTEDQGRAAQLKRERWTEMKKKLKEKLRLQKQEFEAKIAGSTETIRSGKQAAKVADAMRRKDVQANYDEKVAKVNSLLKAALAERDDKKKVAKIMALITAELSE